MTFNTKHDRWGFYIRDDDIYIKLFIPLNTVESTVQNLKAFCKKRNIYQVQIAHEIILEKQ